jgi:hypothetical protein
VLLSTGHYPVPYMGNIDVYIEIEITEAQKNNAQTLIVTISLR